MASGTWVEMQAVRRLLKQSTVKISLFPVISGERVQKYSVFRADVKAAGALKLGLEQWLGSAELSFLLRASWPRPGAAARSQAAPWTRSPSLHHAGAQ